MKRNELLREMGLGPLWRLRAAAPAQADGGTEASLASTPAPTPMPAVSPPATPMPETVTMPAPPEITADREAGNDGAIGWDELAAAVASCRRCRLCEKRKQAVLGVGDRNADWLFVGEGPGAEEDQRGEPFVGQAGKLLDSMLGSIGLRRGEGVYIANAVKCRPPENRTPEADEIVACRPWLMRQIELVRPRLLVALGRPAAQTLLQAEVKVGAARGRLHDVAGIPLVVTYHPAYLLRNLADKAKAWEDLCFMRRTMQSRKDG